MVNRVVVDTSLAVKWVLEEDFSPEAETLRERWEQRGVTIVVPGWFACEIGNALYQNVRARRLDLHHAQLGVVGLLDAVTVYDVEPVVTLRALAYARLYQQSASYDAQYLALAEHLDCELWTADRRFWNEMKTDFPRVRWVGEIATEADSTTPK